MKLRILRALIATGVVAMGPSLAHAQMFNSIGGKSAPAAAPKVVPPPALPGGDRAAINSLHRVDLVRMSNDARARAYVIRQLANGRTKRDVGEPTQTRHRPRDVQTPDATSTTTATFGRPPNQKHHLDCGRRSLGRLAHRHLPTRTRTPTQPHNRRQLSPMAQRRLTNTSTPIGASVSAIFTLESRSKRR